MVVVKNDLFDYENRFIYQEDKMFKFSLDSILLAEFAQVNQSFSKVVDLCCGNMAVGLILSTYSDAKITGFEIQEKVWKLGKNSIELNNLNDQLDIINADANDIKHYFDSESCDAVLCNPPFFKINDVKVVNNNTELSIARHELKINLEDVFKISKYVLKNESSLYLVHRSERLDDIICLGRKYNIPVKLINFVSTKKGKNPSIVLVKCVKNGKNMVTINPEICIDGVKTYQNIFRR